MTATAQQAGFVTVPDPAAPWRWWRVVGFRFVFVYFWLYVLPFPLGNLPLVGDAVDGVAARTWNAVTVWTGTSLLGIEGEIRLGPTGSGDMTVDYIRVLVMLVLAAMVAAVWTLRTTKRRYPALGRWLTVACSYYLGLVMLFYGLVKVIPTQFSPPSLVRLLQTYGESSPMGIAWTFLGFSPAYTVFAGLGEAVGGMLIFFRRTRTLGAVILTAVLTNVVMVNVCFDVPVKLFSFHLLVMALALVARDGRRLLAVFVHNRPAPAADDSPLVKGRRMRLALAGFAALLVGMGLWNGLSNGVEAYRTWGAGRTLPEIWGIYDVDTFVMDGETRPPLLTDETRWRSLVVDRALPTAWQGEEQPGSIAVLHMDGSFRHHRVLLDEDADTFTAVDTPQAATDDGDAATDAAADVLRYERPEPGRLVVRGTWQGADIEVTLIERDMDTVLLTARGFRWINEYPFNR